MSTTETWNQLPRVVRGGVLVLLGSGATFAALYAPSNETSSERAATSVSFPVGVGCAEKPSRVVQTHTGDTFTLRCVNPDGTDGTVTALGELIRNHSLHPEGYDTVIDVTSPDITADSAVISFDFTGANGQATIGFEQEVADTVNNDRLNGILRVTNIPALPRN